MSDTFAEDLKRICEKQKQTLDTVIRVITLELFTAVIEKTPVFSPKGDEARGRSAVGGVAGGQARGNWQVGVNSMPEGIVADAVVTSGPAIRGRVSAKLRNEKMVGNTIWLVNNLPYIRVLEYGEFPNPPKKGTGRTIGGFSTQAPAGMVRLSVDEAKTAIAKWAREGAKE